MQIAQMQTISDWKSSFLLTASLNVNMAGGEKQIVKFAKVISYPNSLTFLLSISETTGSLRHLHYYEEGYVDV